MERKYLVRICLVAILLILSTLWFFLSISSGARLPESSTGSLRTPLPNGEINSRHNIPLEVLEEREDTVDGVRRYTRHDQRKRPSILFLVLTKDADSWGYNLNQPPRAFGDFLTLLRSTGLDMGNVTLALLTSSEQQYKLFQTAARDLDLAGLTVFLHPGYAEEELSRDQRHDDANQVQRRSQIARLRNYLMLRSLRDEFYIIWLDADVYELHSPEIIKKMLSHAGNPEVGVVTARCEVGPVADYDGNAWRGASARVSAQHADKNMCMNNTELEETKRVETLIESTTDNDIIQLDSVGATILYMRASLVHRGLSFPDAFVIGATWDKPGWDGIETEGLCYRAKSLQGGNCYVLGGKWYVRHTDR